MITNTAQRSRRHSRAKARRGFMDLIRLAMVIALITIVAILIIRYVIQREPAVDTFCEGVYVNGISLGGMRYDDGVAAVMDGLDQRLNGTTYTLTYQDKQWEFTPSKFGARLETDINQQLMQAWNFGHTGSARDRRDQAEYVQQNPQYYDSTIVYDEAALDAFLEGIKAEVDVAPVDAYAVPEPGARFTIYPSQDGLVLSTEDLRAKLDRAIREGSEATIVLEPQPLPATVSTQDIEDNTKLVATYPTPLGNSSTNRIRNIRRALQPFNGYTVPPGATISFNEVVGKRTKRNRFYKALEYDGTSVVEGIGGGTCQASSTLYGALLYTQMDIVQRSTHTMTVFYSELSMDATVNNTNKDLRFTNPTAYPYYIYTQVDGKTAQVDIYGPPNKYEIDIEVKLISTGKEPTKSKYVKDTSGKNVYYASDEPVLKEAGKPSQKSQAIRVYYDKETGAEVYREPLEIDTYYEKQPEYWVGVH